MPTDTTAAPEEDLAPYFTAGQVGHPPPAERMLQAYRLRFQVYCIDCRFLDAAAYPDEEERDEYDGVSDHFFANNLDDELAGYARLVRGDQAPDFPWEAHCPAVLPGITLPPAAESAEVSRLMVRRDYRRRKGDLVAGANTGASSQPDPPLTERRTGSTKNTPQIMLCLYRQMYQRSRQTGVRYWYAAMETPLARTLQFMGFAFQRIGDEVDYFGPVAPYLADLDRLEQDLAADAPELLAWMRGTIT